ncbi:hypothetical protein [Streptomyces sp. NPDC093568]|uniref:hypothetical protein n=1 Tax=Streptomyces sp. NPDC093568 TaxID=3366041 RepID=UPI0038202B67
MRDHTATAAHTDSPATALGPVALVLGLISTLGAFVLFPIAWIAAGLAVTFGATGMHYARQGIGRMWTAALGTALGLAGLFGGVALLGALGGWVY